MILYNSYTGVITTFIGKEQEQAYQALRRNGIQGDANALSDLQGQMIEHGFPRSMRDR